MNDGKASTPESPLGWEKRWGVPAGVVSMLAALLLTQALFVQGALLDNRPGFEPSADFLLSLDDRPSAFLISAIVQALGGVALIGAFYYLFRAIRHRTPEVPEMLRWIVILAPLLYAVGTILGVLERTDAADSFASGLPIRGDAGEDRADDLLGDTSTLALGLGFAGTLGMAALFVMLSLRAMRAGLLSRFMGILGVIVGALTVLPLVPGGQAIVQLYWLVGIGALFIGRWPGGRGPAWDSGEAIPWPSAAERQGRLRGNASEAGEEEAPERPASRKRRKSE